MYGDRALKAANEAIDELVAVLDDLEETGDACIYSDLADRLVEAIDALADLKKEAENPAVNLNAL